MNNKMDIFNRDGLEKIDEKIRRRMEKPTLVDTLEEQKNRARDADDMTWGAEIQEYWYIYFFIAISAIFTGTLGFYMGTAPTRGPLGVTFHTDLFHLFLALVYILAFVGNTEVAFVLAKRKFFTREESNGTQKFTMVAAMCVALIGIIGTGIAGGLVVASTLEFLSDFVEVPHAAQKWVIGVIPVMLAIYSSLFTIYHLSSRKAKMDRMTREQLDRMSLDQIVRRRAITLVAEDSLQEAELAYFQEMVANGRLGAGEALAAIRAGKTLGQLERESGKDIDGFGGVGKTRVNASRKPAYASEAEDFTKPSDRS
jgi:hypothetical protein